MYETDEEELNPPRLRNKPRLAKIKSVQNMKLLTQSMSPKGFLSKNNSTDRKSCNKDEIDNDTNSVKGDDEDEIAELMLASTTIKKNTVNRKKNKQARELESLKKLIDAENNVNQEERLTKFAASFIQKLYDILKFREPEALKKVLRYLSQYSEKIDGFPQSDNDDYSSAESGSTLDSGSQRTVHFQDSQSDFTEDKDRLAINLYLKICDILKEYPELCSDFLLFLTPYQAAILGKFSEHTMMTKMSDFINVSQVYFTKQPSKLAKLMQAITEIATNSYITIDIAHSTMAQVLKGHPHLIDMFLQILPNGKPPESLFAGDMFENVFCPVGPHDKFKAYNLDAPELYENIELPISTVQDDPYGGENCKCNCHTLNEEAKPKVISEHCAACGTKFSNGKIFLQTSEGLRPAKLTFPGSDDENLENINRVSLNTITKYEPEPPPKRRRKSSKNDSAFEEQNPKSSTSKSSPTKENEEGDKSNSKSKKGIKSSPKSSESKRLSRVPPSLKIKKDKKIDIKKEIKTEQKTDDESSDNCTNKSANIYDLDTEEMAGNTTSEEFALHIDLSDSHEEDPTTSSSPDKLYISSSAEKVDGSTDSDNSVDCEIEFFDNKCNVQTSGTRPWTKDEDKVILENFRKGYSEKIFHEISLLLTDRTDQEVRERFDYLLSLLTKMY